MENNNLCKECGKSFKSRSGLSDHERRHTSRAPYKCCGYSFYSRAHLTRHRCSAHDQEKMYQCRKCQKKFSLEGDLHRHETKESCGPQNKCNTCGQLFHQLADLAEHIDKHLGTKNFICVCGKSYRYHSGLSRHKKTCT